MFNAYYKNYRLLIYIALILIFSITLPIISYGISRYKIERDQEARAVQMNSVDYFMPKYFCSGEYIETKGSGLLSIQEKESLKALSVYVNKTHKTLNIYALTNSITSLNSEDKAENSYAKTIKDFLIDSGTSTDSLKIVHRNNYTSNKEYRVAISFCVDQSKQNGLCNDCDATK